MRHEFAMDLKVQRRRSGLSQADCAHLLSIHPSKVSLLESGQLFPSLKDVCALTILYGRSFESLFGSLVSNVAHDVKVRLDKMPAAPTRWLPTFNRQRSLEELAERLEELSYTHHETT